MKWGIHFKGEASPLKWIPPLESEASFSSEDIASKAKLHLWNDAPNAEAFSRGGEGAPSPPPLLAFPLSFSFFDFYLPPILEIRNTYRTKKRKVLKRRTSFCRGPKRGPDKKVVGRWESLRSSSRLDKFLSGSVWGRLSLTGVNF